MMILIQLNDEDDDVDDVDYPSGKVFQRAKAKPGGPKETATQRQGFTSTVRVCVRGGGEATSG